LYGMGGTDVVGKRRRDRIIDKGREVKGAWSNLGLREPYIDKMMEKKVFQPWKEKEIRVTTEGTKKSWGRVCETGPSLRRGASGRGLGGEYREKISLCNFIS